MVEGIRRINRDEVNKGHIKTIKSFLEEQGCDSEVLEENDLLTEATLNTIILIMKDTIKTKELKFKLNELNNLLKTVLSCLNSKTLDEIQIKYQKEYQKDIPLLQEIV